MLDGGSAHLLGGGLECGHTGTEGEGGTGQHTAGVGLDIHLAPGHLPEGLPLTGPGHVLALQQVAQEEGLGRQRGHLAAVQGPDGVVGMGQSELPADQVDIKFISIPLHASEPGGDVRRIQAAVPLLIMGKGDFFLVIFDLHYFSSLFV